MESYKNELAYVDCCTPQDKSFILAYVIYYDYFKSWIILSNIKNILNSKLHKTYILSIPIYGMVFVN